MKSDQGYPVKKFPGETKRYCQTLSLIDHPDLIAAYRKAHSREEHWTEICQGLRQVGILEMEIYIHANQLFMIVEAPADFDWTTAMERLSRLPRQEEWEAHIGQFQQCSPGSTSSEKWELMERMFRIYD